MKNIIKYEIEFTTSIVFLLLEVLFFVILLSSINIVVLYVILSTIFFILFIIDSIKRFRKYIRQIDTEETKKINKNIYLFNQIILPISMYIGTISFILLNSLDLLTIQFFIVLSTILFYILIKHIEVYLETFEFDERTHYIINGVKVYIFFLLSYSVLQISSIINLSVFLVPVFVFTIALTLLLLLIQRNKQFLQGTIWYAISISFVIGISVFLMDIFVNNAIITAFTATSLFYFFEAILHHKLENKLSNELIIEYILFLVIIFLIIKGLFGIYV